MIFCLPAICLAANAQTVTISEIEVDNQSRLSLEIPFADEIKFKTWQENSVQVESHIMINNGRDDDLFRINFRKSSRSIHVKMDKKGWEEIFNDCWGDCWSSVIKITVNYPEGMSIDAETINADYVLDYYNRPGTLKTISGDIDMSVPDSHGIDFRAKTISGEVYSDIDEIDYPEGRDGLNQMVGINIMGQIYGGGPEMKMETISGDIFLRKR